MQEFYEKNIKELYSQIAQDNSVMLSSQETSKPIDLPDSHRIIPLNYKIQHKKYARNAIKTQKYSWPLFLPLSILEQFKVFSNQYFLFISLTQIFPQLQINLAFTYYLPLVFVVATSVIKNLFDDLGRWRRDKTVNSQKYNFITKCEVESQKLQPGDILILKKDQRAPADILVLQTLDERGVIYIRTDNLDGEIDWKTRKSIPVLQQLPFCTGISEVRGIVQCGELSKNIYQFNGKYVHYGATQKQVHSLSYENTIWQNCVVANSECVCLVLNTGKDTRSAMNTSKPRIKEGRTDIQMNLFVKGLFLFLIVVALVFTIFSADNNFLTFLRFFVIYSAIIPVSLKVCMELGKLMVSYGVKRDKAMSRIQVNTTSIPEQLGKITHIFSDKTGTLTKNVMRVLKLIYGENHVCNGAVDVLKYLQRNNEQISEENEAKSTQLAYPDQKKVMQYAELRQKMYQTQQKKTHSLDNYTPRERLQFLMKGMATCHSVSLQKGELLASSPDEVALVKFAHEAGMELTYRDDFQMKINDETYQIKYIFPFTSVTKRMSIILYDENEHKYFLFVKGADSVISKLLVQNYTWLYEKIDQLSSDGLRTLVFSFKELQPEQFQEFDSKYQEASCLLQNREEKQLEVENALLQNMFLLGITGVEDQLQDGVQKTLEMFRSAGIRTWILSGDKIQTIQCIALSSRLIDPMYTKFHVIEGQTNFYEAIALLRQTGPRDCLVIDGASLSTILGQREYNYYLKQKLSENQPETLQKLGTCKKVQKSMKTSLLEYFTGKSQRSLGDDARDEFARITSELPAVCCCRCSPDQKALICKLISNYTQSETAGIGDGANDVSLLQAASVGFGIFGKEGVQAAMAADFAIGEFKDIQQLLFWHGRLSYKNTVECCQFIIQRGMCSSFMQAFYSAIYFFSATTLFNGVQMLGYATVYNILPVLCMYFNEDVDYHVAMKYPELYKKLIKGRLLNARTFFMWNSIALSMATLIIFTSIQLIQMQFERLVLVSFTVLAVVQLELICLTVQRWSWVMIAMQLVSVVLYFISLFIQLDSFPMGYILNYNYYLSSVISFLCSGGVIYMIWLCLKCCKPDEIQKLRFTQEKSTCCGCCKTLVHTKSSTGDKYFNL